MSLLDYFPAYAAYGLRELATTRDDQQILTWVEQVLPRSFDALASERRVGFVRYAAMIAGELLPALTRAEVLMSQHAHSHESAVVAAESTLLGSARMILELQEQSDSSSAEGWAGVLDAVLAAVSAARLIHEEAR